MGRSRSPLTWTSLLAVLVMLPGLLSAGARGKAGEVLNGFDLSDLTIPLREVMPGGPPRDGIPALTDPAREPADAGDRWLREEDRVIGVAMGGEAVAYPLAILSWHELVNDVVGGRPLLVTYCPLCGTGIVFDARLGAGRREFGVSGLLFRSDALLYDRATDSLFSQLLMRGVSGPLRDQPLRPVPYQITTWSAWRRAHPETQVLSLNTGYAKDYFTDPYGWYHRSRATMFPVRFKPAGRDAKDWSFLVDPPEAPVLVAEEVAASWEGGAHELPDGRRLIYHADERRLEALDPSGRSLTVVPGYWFAHRAFYPDAPIIDRTAR